MPSNLELEQRSIVGEGSSLEGMTLCEVQVREGFEAECGVVTEKKPKSKVMKSYRNPSPGQPRSNAQSRRGKG